MARSVTTRLGGRFRQYRTASKDEIVAKHECPASSTTCRRVESVAAWSSTRRTNRSLGRGGAKSPMVAGLSIGATPQGVAVQVGEAASGQDKRIFQGDPTDPEREPLCRLITRESIGIVSEGNESDISESIESCRTAIRLDVGSMVGGSSQMTSNALAVVVH